VFELAKEILNKMAGFIQLPVIFPKCFTATPGRNDDLDSGLLQRFDDTFLGVISLVRDHRSRLDVDKDKLRSDQIVNLTRRQAESGWVAQGIDPSMNFRRRTAARATDRLLVLVTANGTATVLMGPNQGTVDHHVFLIGIFGQKREQLGPKAFCRPSAKPSMNVLEGAECVR
jgi:hypothetical protein